MAKTYLELVNSVLTRLRDGQAISVSDSDDTLLIGEFVNEAKEWAEDAHTWSALRSTVQISLTSSDYAASLTGAGNRSQIIQLVNDTTDYEFRDAHPYKKMNTLLTANDIENAEPYLWDVNGTDSNGDPVLNFYPPADQAYTINVNIYKPQAELSSDSTELTIPSLPVILYAYYLAVQERGEEGGTSVQAIRLRAEDALRRAIEVDEITLWDENVWEII